MLRNIRSERTLMRTLMRKLMSHVVISSPFQELQLNLRFVIIVSRSKLKRQPRIQLLLTLEQEASQDEEHSRRLRCLQNGCRSEYRVSLHALLYT